MSLTINGLWRSSECPTQPIQHSIDVRADQCARSHHPVQLLRSRRRHFGLRINYRERLDFISRTPFSQFVQNGPNRVNDCRLTGDIVISNKSHLPSTSLALASSLA